jgi:hypothetical protein
MVSEVMGARKDVYRLKFEGEEDDKEMEVDRRFVLDILRAIESGGVRVSREDLLANRVRRQVGAELRNGNETIARK